MFGNLPVWAIIGLIVLAFLIGRKLWSFLVIAAILIIAGYFFLR